MINKVLTKLGRPVMVVNAKNDKVTLVNGPAEEILGDTEKSILGESWELFFDVRSRKRIRALIEIQETSKSPEGRREQHLRLKRRSGRALDINLTLTLIKTAKKKEWIFDLEDLSQIMALQKEKEDLLNEMAKVSKLADIGRLTGGIAHELNNPLAIIQGITESLESAIEDGETDPKILLRDIHPLKETILRMTRIIQSMMSVARGEEPVLEALTVQDIWDRAAVGFQTFQELKDVRVVNKIDPDIAVDVDSIRVEQIFVNLIKNAIHALEPMPANERQIQVSTEETQDQICIHVDNTGPTIPLEISENLFTPFFTTKPVGKGFGLGLFLAYNVMKAHGGHMLTKNLAAENGVRFTLAFPKSLKKVRRKSHHNILIVDDEPLFRQVFARKLEQLGYIVTMARTPAEAIVALKSNVKFSLLLSDFRMPGQTGAELVGQIRLFSKIPIVFVTGFAQEAALKALRAQGAIQGVLTKPIDQAVLVNQLDLIFNQRVQA